MISSNVSRSGHRNSVSFTAISRLKLRSIASGRLVNVEKSESEKKKVYFAAFHPCNLALITHNSPQSVKDLRRIAV